MVREREGFFVVGGTLGSDTESYIPRSADRALYDSLRKGDFAYVLDSRQKGKSSLMIRTRKALESEGIRTVLLDLQRFGSNLEPEQWYASLLLGAGEELGIEDRVLKLWDGQPHAGPMQRFFQALEAGVRELRAEVVVFVDEIDFVRSLPFSTDEFFAGIRESFNRRATGSASSLTFCLLGVATPSELIRDVQITPFNVGKRVELTDFTLEELSPYAKALSADGRDGRALVNRIHHWTAGHPYLTQKLSAAVMADAAVRSAGGVDRLVESLFFSVKARTEEPNLSDVARRVLEAPLEGVGAEEARARVLDLYHQVRQGRRVRDDETDPIASILKLSGLTRILEGYLVVRNRIYFRAFDRSWVESNLPDAEILRQRRAARAAAVRVGTLSGAITLGIAALAIFALSKAAEANRATLRAESKTQSEALARQEASKRATEAETERKRANKEAELARSAERLAERRAAELAQEVKRTQSALAQATAATIEAKRQQRQAVAARGVAKARELEADRQRRAAVTANQGAQRLLYIANTNLINEAWAQSDYERAKELLEQVNAYDLDPYTPERGYWRHLVSTSLLQTTADDAQPVLGWTALATHDNGAKVRIVDINNGKILQEHSSPYPVSGLQSSSDQRLIVPTANSNLDHAQTSSHTVMWDLSSHTEYRLPTGSPATEASFSPTGAYLITVNYENLVQVWALDRLRNNTPDPRLSIEFEEDLPEPEVDSFVWRDNGQVLLTRGMTIELWDLVAKQRKFSMTPPFVNNDTLGIIRLSFVSNSSYLLATYRFHTSDIPELVLLDLNSGTVQPQLNRGIEVQISPDGQRYALYYGQTRQVTVFDTISGELLFTVDGAAWSGVLEFDPSGRYLAYETPRGVALADIERQETLWQRDVSGRLSSIQFTPDGLRLILTFTDEGANVLSAADGLLIQTIPAIASAWSTVISPDSSRLLAAGAIWDLKVSRAVIEHRGGNVSLSSDGGRITRVSLEDGVIEAIDSRTRRVLSSSKPVGDTETVYFSPCSTRLVFASSEVVGGEIRDFRLMDLNGELLTTFRSLFAPPGDPVLFDKASKYVVYCEDQMTVVVRSILEGEIVVRIPMKEEITSLAFSDIGDKVAIVTRGDRLVVVDCISGETVVNVKLRLAVGENSENPSDGARLFNILTWSSSGMILTTEMVYVFLPAKDVSSARSRDAVDVSVISGLLHDSIAKSIAMSGDGSLFALVDRNEVGLFDVRSRRIVKLLKGHKGQVTGMAFSPDGSRLATSCVGDESIRIWEVKSGREVLKIRCFPEYSEDLRFSPCGRILWQDQGGRVVGYVMDTSVSKDIVFSTDLEWSDRVLQELFALGSEYSWEWHTKVPVFREFLQTAKARRHLVRGFRSMSSKIAEATLELLEPASAETLRLFSDARVFRSDWKGASAVLRRVLDGKEARIADRKALALVSLASSDQMEFLNQARLCAQLAINPSVQADQLFEATIAVRILPNVLNDYEPLLAAVERAAASDPAQYANASSPGILLFRMGRHEEALGRLEPSVKANNRFGQIFSAMALAKLGRLEEAKSMLETVVAWASSKGPGGAQTNLQLQRWAFRFELELLINEAKELLGVKKTSPIVAQLSQAIPPNLQSLLSPALSGGTR